MKLRYKKYYTINGIEEHNCKLCGFEYDNENVKNNINQILNEHISS